MKLLVLHFLAAATASSLTLESSFFFFFRLMPDFLVPSRVSEGDKGERAGWRVARRSPVSPEVQCLYVGHCP